MPYSGEAPDIPLGERVKPTPRSPAIVWLKALRSLTPRRRLGRAGLLRATGCRAAVHTLHRIDPDDPSPQCEVAGALTFRVTGLVELADVCGLHLGCPLQ
jgi:hypothetical protein